MRERSSQGKMENQVTSGGDEVSRANPVKDGLLMMEKTEEEIGNLTAEEICFESLKIWKKNAWLFISLQLTLGLPSVLLTIYATFLLWSHVPSEYSQLFMPSASSTPSPTLHVPYLHYVQMETGPLAISWDNLLLLLPVIGIGILGSVALLAIHALSVSANIYAVVLLFTDRTVSFFSVLKGAIPRLWMRLFITILCWLDLLWPAMLVFGGFHVLVAWSTSRIEDGHPLPVPALLFFPLVLVRDLLYFCIFIFAGMMFMVVSGVCVFEENFGWPVLTRARLLVQGKLGVAKRVHLRFLSLEFVAFFFVVNMRVVVFSDFCQSVELHPLYILLLVAAIGLVTHDLQMASISAGVTYVSFKSYHETVAECSLLENAIKGGYQPLPDKVDPADLASVDKPHSENLV